MTVFSFFPISFSLCPIDMSLSLLSWLLFFIALFVSQTFLSRQGFTWAHWIFLLIFLATEANTEAEALPPQVHIRSHGFEAN